MGLRGFVERALATAPWARLRYLESASRLGDRAAAKEIKRMSDNATIGWIGRLAGAVLGGVVYFGFQSCDHYKTQSVREREAELAAEQKRIELTRELDLKRMQQAYELRQKYVQGCRLTPDQAEALFPVPPPSVVPPVECDKEKR